METRAVVSNVADLFKDLIDELLPNSVVTTSIVIGGILFSSDHLLGMKEASIGASADFIDHIGLEIAVDSARNIFAIAC